MRLVEASRRLAARAGELRFAAPVAHVYNPLDYAWQPHSRYLRRFAEGRKEIVLLGMNPGPFGMAQTGVPFGEVALVRDWLGISGRVGKPESEHPKRPVLGFSCPRSEVSGRRLWSWVRQRFSTPERFFARFYVHNYCPLAFVTDRGANLTPDKLPAAAAAPLLELCDAMLREVVEVLRPQRLIGIGAYAERRARAALSDLPLTIGRIPHPSPASPLANRGWEPAVEAALAGQGIAL